MLAEMLPERYVRSFRSDEVIFQEGAPGTHMYVVQEGSVRICRGADGAPLSMVETGEIFGEMALIDGSPRSATAVAGADGARVIEIDHALFIYLVGQQPAFPLMVMQCLARRLRQRESAATGRPA